MTVDTLPGVNANLVRVGGLFAVAAGVLEILAGLRLFDQNPAITELLYVVTDLCCLPAILAWYLFQQTKVQTSLGLWGFLLMFLGTAFIAGPSAEVFGIAAYSLGVPVIGIGLAIMCFTSWQGKALPNWLTLFFLVSMVTMAASPTFSFLYQPISFGNLTYGICFLGLGFHLLGVRE